MAEATRVVKIPCYQRIGSIHQIQTCPSGEDTTLKRRVGSQPPHPCKELVSVAVGLQVGNRAEQRQRRAGHKTNTFVTNSNTILNCKPLLRNSYNLTYNPGLKVRYATLRTELWCVYRISASALPLTYRTRLSCRHSQHSDDSRLSVHTDKDAAAPANL